MKVETYTQNWRAYNKAQQREKSLFMELLSDLCSGIEEAEYKFGRPKNKLSDMVFCSAFKVYSMYSGRRFTSDMKFANEKNYISKVPHFNSVFNCLKMKKLTPILNELIVKSSEPLSSVETDFAVDSSGFTTSSYKQWSQYRVRRGIDYHVWVKAHLMCGVKTNIVTSAILTEGVASDTRQFTALVDSTRRRFAIGEVSADKAYSSRENMECVRKAGGTAYIPFRSNTTGVSRGSLLWSKMYHYFMTNQEDFYQHYHKRSNVESTFFMIKSKFGSNVRSRTKTAQYNEVLCKILCHNICVLIQEMHEIGIQGADLIRLRIKSK